MKYHGVDRNHCYVPAVTRNYSDADYYADSYAEPTQAGRYAIDDTPPYPRHDPTRRRKYASPGAIGAAAVVVLLVALALGYAVVKMGSTSKPAAPANVTATSSTTAPAQPSASATTSASPAPTRRIHSGPTTVITQGTQTITETPAPSAADTTTAAPSTNTPAPSTVTVTPTATDTPAPSTVTVTSTAADTAAPDTVTNTQTVTVGPQLPFFAPRSAQ